ncbi:hypothetical protein D3C71_20160 [compost metagenome]
MRIHQNAVFLSGLLKDAQAGSLVPAAFQRPYVWTQADVLALCNSVLKSFPLGGFLTWSPSRGIDLGKVARGRLGPVEPDAAGIDRLLLDGQNRLATLAWMSREEGTPLPDNLSEAERATWGNGQVLAIDLASRKFSFVAEAEAGDGFMLPARCAFGGAGVNSILRARWNTSWAKLPEEDKNSAMNWLDRDVMDRFRGARVVETFLENATVDEAKEAFLHICKVGVPMSDKDFAAATAWAL